MISSFTKMGGERSPADILTKPVPHDVMQGHLVTLGCRAVPPGPGTKRARLRVCVCVWTWMDMHMPISQPWGSMFACQRRCSASSDAQGWEQPQR